MRQRTPKGAERFSTYLPPEDAARIEAARASMSLDGEKLSESAFVAVLVRRGLRELEREAGATEASK